MHQPPTIYDKPVDIDAIEPELNTYFEENTP